MDTVDLVRDILQQQNLVTYQNCDNLLIEIVEYFAEFFNRRLRHLNRGPGRVSSECSHVLEKTAKEAIASRLPLSRVIYYLWLG